MSDNAIDLKIRRCADILRSGGVVVCPTEGIYGLSAAANHDDAILRIIDIKRRDPNKGLIMVGSSFEMVRKYIDVSAIAPDTFRQMLCTWPGHHTLGSTMHLTSFTASYRQQKNHSSKGQSF